MTFLASDECEGRGPTTQGLNKAADYVAAEFKEAGLQPGLKGEYFQPFKIAGADGKVTLVGPNDKRIELHLECNFSRSVMTLTGKASGGVVFAGYGITSKSPEYDDYAGIDVMGKVVILLRDKPKDKQAAGSKEMINQAGLVNKMEAAKKKGARRRYHRQRRGNCRRRRLSRRLQLFFRAGVLWPWENPDGFGASGGGRHDDAGRQEHC